MSAGNIYLKLMSLKSLDKHWDKRYFELDGRIQQVACIFD